MRRKSKSRPSGKRSSLWFVALLLGTSAVLRLTDNSEALVAFASETLDATETNETSMVEPTNDDQGNVDFSKILDGLARREAIVKEREERLEERLAALRLAEAEIQKNLIALETAEEDLRATMALAVTAAEDDLSRLTTVYENMKPKEAASLFEEMSPEFAAGFLSRMRPDAAADIMVGLEPATAYSISVIMAGRNANAPTE